MTLDLSGELLNREILVGTLPERTSLTGALSPKTSITGSLSDNPINRAKSYTSLSSKPSINNIELVGNKDLTELGIQKRGNYVLEDNICTISNKEIEEKFKF